MALGMPEFEAEFEVAVDVILSPPESVVETALQLPCHGTRSGNKTAIWIRHLLSFS